MKMKALFNRFIEKFEAPVVDCAEAKRFWYQKGYYLICPEEDQERAKQECLDAVTVATRLGEKVVCMEYPSFQLYNK